MPQVIFGNDHPSNAAAREAREKALAEGKSDAQANKAGRDARRRFMGLPTHEDCQKRVEAIWAQARADLDADRKALKVREREVNRKAREEVAEVWASLKRWE